MFVINRKETILRVCIETANGDQLIRYFTAFPTLETLKKFVGSSKNRKIFRAILDAANPALVSLSYDTMSSSPRRWSKIVKVAGVIIGTITYNKMTLYTLDDKERMQGFCD